LIDRSIANSASMRRTTSMAIGERGISLLPMALRRMFSSMSGFCHSWLTVANQDGVSDLWQFHHVSMEIGPNPVEAVDSEANPHRLVIEDACTFVRKILP
jgi:hypothetical protein